MKRLDFLRRFSDRNEYTAEYASAIMTGLLFLSFFAVSFFVAAACDALRYFHYASVFFTLFWSMLFASFILILPRRVGRGVFAVLYLFLLIYGTAEHVYFKIFNKLFSFTVLSNLHEGAGYMGASVLYLEPLAGVCAVLLLLLGIYIWLRLDRIVVLPRHTRIALLPVALAAVIAAQAVLPRTYGKKTDYAVWNSFEDARYVYDNYTNPHKCMGLCGYYQYLALDFYNCFLRPLTTDVTVQHEELELFFEKYPSSHKKNDMTGLFAGKNAIIVMMESMDHLAISEENTPNVAMMMREGINFPNYYAAVYGDGATFSNEFVMNTGIYAPSNGTAAYAYISNDFGNSLPSLFRSAGYSANSYHENHGWFYNRALMHAAFGYEKYNSYYEFGGEHDEVIVDTYLTRTPELTDALFHRAPDDDRPFLDFVITYSAHLAYTYDGELAEYAYENYVNEGESLGGTEDLDVLMAKARITDTMLGELIEQMDENTVLICATDHYAYGLDVKTLSAFKGDEWALRQRTPLFIYSKSDDLVPMQVDKICSNADFLPTIANLFGLGVPDRLMGHDIFDPDYKGWVVFSNYAWLTEEVYWHDAVLEQYCDDYSEDLVHDMTAYVFRRVKCNDYLLACDYYAKHKEGADGS